MGETLASVKCSCQHQILMSPQVVLAGTVPVHAGCTLQTPAKRCVEL